MNMTQPVLEIVCSLLQLDDLIHSLDRGPCQMVQSFICLQLKFIALGDLVELVPPLGGG